MISRRGFLAGLGAAIAGAPLVAMAAKAPNHPYGEVVWSGSIENRIFSSNWHHTLTVANIPAHSHTMLDNYKASQWVQWAQNAAARS